MDKKIPAVVLLASLTGEAVLLGRHEDVLSSQPHTETVTQVPSAAPLSTAAGGGGGGASFTLKLTPNDEPLSTTLHTEIETPTPTTAESQSSSGGGRGLATGGTIVQLA
jgi:hypothetical protein